TAVAQANRPMSEKRGTTCAAFVAASYQTAAMTLFLDGCGLLWNIEAGYKILRDLVETKGEARKRRAEALKPLARPVRGGPPAKKTLKSEAPADPHEYQDYALREHSNKRLKVEGWSGLTVNEQWKKFYKLFFEKSMGYEATEDPPDINTIIPAGFFYDVKYVNAPLLSTALEGAGWAHTTYDSF